MSLTKNIDIYKDTAAQTWIFSKFNVEKSKWSNSAKLENGTKKAYVK